MAFAVTKVLSVVCIIALPGCSRQDSTRNTVTAEVQTQDGSEFIGVWANNVAQPYGSPTIHQVARIEKNGESYLVTFASDGNAGLGGTFPAEYEKGVLKTGNVTIGNIAHSATQDSIFVLGQQFSKSSEQAEETRSAQIAAAQRQQQEAAAEEQRRGQVLLEEQTREAHRENCAHGFTAECNYSQ